MSSATYIARTRFQTLGTDGAVYTTYGARVYDDHESAYVNQLDSLDELMALDPDELIDHIRDNSTAAGDIIDMATYCDVPLYVDDELHSGGEGEDEDLTAHLGAQTVQSEAEFSVLQPGGNDAEPLGNQGE